MSNTSTPTPSPDGTTKSASGPRRPAETSPSTCTTTGGRPPGLTASESCSTRARRCGRGAGQVQPRLPAAILVTGHSAGRKDLVGDLDRVVGPLADDRLHGYRWDNAVGARVDLTPGRESVAVDIEGQPTLIWSGPAVAPMAIAAVSCLYGRLAMIEHPGLASLRVSPNLSEEA